MDKNLSQLLAVRITELRKNLIDFTRRNPLIKTNKKSAYCAQIDNANFDDLLARLSDAEEEISLVASPSQEEDLLTQKTVSSGIEEALQDEPQLNNSIQIKLQPKEFERRIKGIYKKTRTSFNEHGVHVLHIAFGFLKWKNSGNELHSPLVLLPIEIKKERTAKGLQYSIQSKDLPETNRTLEEKLKLELNIELPLYDGESIKDYFEKIDSELRHDDIQEIQQEIVIGAFSSSLMAMYYDLDPSNEELLQNSIVDQLLLGSNETSMEASDEKYEVDDPEIEKKVPHLVIEADVSQYKTLVDIARGKNLALEGPPGTGKSQTIVNAIAGAIHKGKKVLVVAEKKAALDVLEARLKTVELSEFVLPLQAGLKIKQKVIQSVRNRIEQEEVKKDQSFESKLKDFKRLRKELDEYASVIGKLYGKSGFTIQELLGKSIAKRECLANVNQKIQNAYFEKIYDKSEDELKAISNAAINLANAALALQNSTQHWRGLTATTIHFLQEEEIKNAAYDASKAFRLEADAEHKLKSLGLENISISNQIDLILKQIKGDQTLNVELVKKLSDKKSLNDIDLFLSACKTLKSIAEASNDTSNKLRKTYNKLDKLFEPFIKVSAGKDSAFIINLHKAVEICHQAGKPVLLLRNDANAENGAVEVIRQASALFKELKKSAEELSKRVSIENDVEAKELRNMAGEIEKVTSIFSKISFSYWSAKRAYMKLSIDKKFDITEAVIDLKNLAKWKENKTQFYNLPGLREILGDQPINLNIDFTDYEELFVFYNSVDENFAGTEMQEIRHFLKKEDLDLLLVCANKINDDWNRDYNSLLEWKRNLDLKFDYLVNTRFDNFNAIEDHLEPELSFAKLLSQLDDQQTKLLIISLLSNNKLDPFRSCLDEYFSLSIKSSEQLRKLLELTGQNSSHFELNRTAAEKADFLEQAGNNSKVLAEHSAFANASTSFKNLAPNLYKVFIEDKISFEQLPDITDALLYKSFAKDIYNEYGAILCRFQGSRLDDLRNKFAVVDKQLISSTGPMLLKKEIMDFAKQLPQGIGRGRKSELTELPLLRSEIEKKRRFIPIRDLITRAGETLQKLKPCWMMSPLAVAEYIPSNTVKFDLCIIDEASQMPPANALGAIFRSKQVVVIGDSKQLPPTNFFNTVFGEYSDEETENEDLTTDEESILDLAGKAFWPPRRLLWHYRSRHQSLFSFSNKLVYDNSLLVYPSVYVSHESQNQDMGVSLVEVEDGIYKKGVNVTEGKKIVNEALSFMEKYPDRSLGIVALNRPQCDFIDLEFEKALLENRNAQNYIERWKKKYNGLERFIIKNLENVQGDERDVIYISTVYGPETSGGKVNQRFGPINQSMGWRRLNVLFTRAKMEIVTFSSLKPNDIVETEDKNDLTGPNMLKKWLIFAKTGRILKGNPNESDRAPDSEFEIHVIEQIKKLGYIAVPQVGEAKYFIDIGVKHSKFPYQYILGVECDGASYHSSKYARDRDRNRQDVLEGLGWYIHRIWSTDWFNTPDKEVKKLKEVIDCQFEKLNSEENA